MVKEELLLSAGLDKEVMNDLLRTQTEQRADAKELLTGGVENDVRTKSDLTTEEIKLVVLAKQYAKLIKSNKLSLMIEDLLFLKISKDRKSRKEFVEAYKNDLPDNQGFFKNLFNRGD